MNDEIERFLTDFWFRTRLADAVIIGIVLLLYLVVGRTVRTLKEKGNVPQRNADGLRHPPVPPLANGQEVRS